MAASSSTSASLAIKSMDLTRATVDILSKGGVASNLAGQLMKYLARDGIAEDEFKNCLDRISSWTYPSEFGLQVQKKLNEADSAVTKKLTVAGLQLLHGGSIGRWMAVDPNFSWVVTTVAALLTHHTMAYAADALCEMVLQTEHKDPKQNAHRQYDIQKARLSPVMRRVVESIGLNVVNAGNDLGQWPKELANVCRHHTDAKKFASVALAIDRSEGNVVIRCRRFLADVFIWILAHIDGDTELSIAGNIVFRKQHGGSPSRSVLMVVDEVCPARSELHASVSNTIEVSTKMGGALHVLLSLKSATPDVTGPTTLVRQPLYDLDGMNRQGRLDQTLSHGELHKTSRVGQGIVRWMMDRSIQPDGLNEIIYAVTAGCQAGGLRSATLLKRLPGICNIELDADNTFAGFKQPPETKNWPENHDETEVLPVQWLLNCFPDAAALHSQVCRRCSCTACSKRQSSQHVEPLPGCLAHSVQNQLMLLIAHAVADGFGAPDASSLTDFKVVRAGVQRLLSELINGKRIAWYTWFAVAACTYLGCPWDVEAIQGPEGAGELVSVQYGNVVVVASWVDLSSDKHLERPFGFEHVEARLRGVEADFGVVYTERSGSAPLGARERGENVLTEHYIHEVDTSDLWHEAAIIGVAGLPYKLMNMIKAGNKYLRIIDPAVAVISLASSQRPRCTHKQQWDQDTMLSMPHRVWSFEEAVGLWNEDAPFYAVSQTESPDSEEYCKSCAVTTTLDSIVKINIALALSPRGCVIRGDRCCLACAKLQLSTGSHPSPTPRRLINTARSSMLVNRRH